MPQAVLHSSVRHFARDFAVRSPQSKSMFLHGTFPEVNQGAVVFAKADVSFSSIFAKQIASSVMSVISFTHYVLRIIILLIIS